MADTQADGFAEPTDARRAVEHMIHLVHEFDGENVLVTIDAATAFLYYLWTSTLEPQGLSLADYASDLGVALGAQHERQQQRQRAAS